jgi:hypothetical protein
VEQANALQRMTGITDETIHGVQALCFHWAYRRRALKLTPRVLDMAAALGPTPRPPRDSLPYGSTTVSWDARASTNKDVDDAVVKWTKPRGQAKAGGRKVVSGNHDGARGI